MEFQKLLVHLFTYMLTLSACAASQPMNAEQAGYAGLGATVFNAFTAFGNPALSVKSRKAILAIGAENRFLTRELQSFLFQAGIPLKSNATIGIFGYNTGTKEYHENQFGCFYALRLSEKLIAGVEIFHQQFKVNETYYPAINSWSACIGIYTQPLSFLEIGACLRNPGSFTKPENISTLNNPSLNLGTAWKISEGLFFRCEFEQKMPEVNSFILAFEYRPNEKISIRSGYRTNPSEPAFGFGLKLKNINFDAACIAHPVLGFYPSVGISHVL